MASDKTRAEQAARHLDNLAQQYNEAADRDRSAAKLLSVAASFVRAQQAENERLVGELAVQQAVAAENEAKVKSDVEVVTKLLNRTHDIAAADKSASVTANSAVRGNIDAAVRVLSNITAGPKK